ncbi:unnamed protein product [Symbiodinium natans]|uniref:Uncharacterized protein n=1 Tax=Symbiodinium natans TaxID=878477 RepID=A0A812P0S4_9DINO|nr:unnamed protein product [Symbiodinium natans]
MAGMGPVPASPCGSPVYPDKERIGHALHLLCTAALVFEADSLVALNCRRALIIVHNPFTQEVEKRAAKPFPASRMSQIRLTGNKLIVSQEHIDLDALGAQLESSFSLFTGKESGAERSALWWPCTELRVLQQQTSQHLAALADIRTDNASLICRHFRAPAWDDGANDSEGAEPVHSRVPRCPRCGWAVARDQDVQSALRFLHRDLQISTEDQAVGHGDAHFIETSAACAGQIDHRAAEFFELWADGGLAATLGRLDALDCSPCELQALDRFAAQVHAEFLAALAALRCADASGEAPSALEPKLLKAVDVLEEALWKGLGFPSLHEAAATAVFALRRGRSAGLARRCPGSSPLPTYAAALDSTQQELTPAFHHEREALRRFANGEPFEPLSLALAYAELAETDVAAQALALCALWLREAAVHGSREAQVALPLVVQSAHRLAVSSLPPASQLIVLRSCSQALASGTERAFAAPARAVAERLEALERQLPFTSPPVPLLVAFGRLESIAERLHLAYARLLQTVGQEELPMDPQAVDTAQLGLFEASAANGRREEAAALHPFAASAAAQELGQGAVRSLRPDGVPLSRSPYSRQESVAEFLGVRFHKRSGLKEVLLRRPTVEESGGRAFAFQGSAITESALPPSLAAVLLHAAAPVGASLEPLGATSPLRRLAVSGAMPGSEASDLLRDALLELQRITADSALSDGTLQLRCATVEFQARFSDHGHTLEALLSEPHLEIHSVPAGLVQNLSALLAAEDAVVQGLVPLRAICGLRAAARLLAAPYSSLSAGEVSPPPTAAAREAAVQWRSWKVTWRVRRGRYGFNGSPPSTRHCCGRLDSKASIQEAAGMRRCSPLPPAAVSARTRRTAGMAATPKKGAVSPSPHLNFRALRP